MNALKQGLQVEPSFPEGFPTRWAITSTSQVASQACYFRPERAHRHHGGRQTGTSGQDRQCLRFDDRMRPTIWAALPTKWVWVQRQARKKGNRSAPRSPTCTHMHPHAPTCTHMHPHAPACPGPLACLLARPSASTRRFPGVRDGVSASAALLGAQGCGQRDAEPDIPRRLVSEAPPPTPFAARCHGRLRCRLAQCQSFCHDGTDRSLSYPEPATPRPGRRSAHASAGSGAASAPQR